MDLHPHLPQRNRMKPLVLLEGVSAASVAQSVNTHVVYMYFVCVSAGSICLVLQLVGPRGRELQQPWCCRATGFSLPLVTTPSQLWWLDGLELVSFIAACATFWIFDQDSYDCSPLFQPLLKALAQHQGLLLTLPHWEAGWGCMRNWEGTWPGQLMPNDPRDTSHHPASCSAVTAGGRRGKRGAFGVTEFVFPRHTAIHQEAVLGMPEHGPACGKWGMNSLFALLVHAAFFHLLNCLQLRQYVFTFSPFRFSPLSHCWGASRCLWGA